MTIVTGEANIRALQLLTLRRGLKLEITTGMTLSRGNSCYKIIKQRFGFKGSKAKVLEQFEAHLTEQGVEFNK